MADLGAIEPLVKQGEDLGRLPLQTRGDRVGEFAGDQQIIGIGGAKVGELNRSLVTIVIGGSEIDPDRGEAETSIATQSAIGRDRRMLNDVRGVLLQVIKDRSPPPIESSIRRGALNDPHPDLRTDLLALIAVVIERAGSCGDIWL